MRHANPAGPFVAGLLIGSATTSAALLCWLCRRARLKQANQAKNNHGTKDAPGAAPGSAVQLSLDDEIIKEQLVRTAQFLGCDGVSKLFDSYVVVVGLGGVGSHAAHLLLRSGIGRLKLVDFDQVTLSSLNRHALATRADVGLPKAQVLAHHFHSIFPDARVDALVTMYTDSSEDDVLGGTPVPAVVVDAIDNLDTKVALLAACQRRGIRVLSVGAAGAKCDPTRLRFLDLADASADPLLRAVRHHLRRRHGSTQGVTALVSSEKPRCGLVTTDAQAEAENLQDYQTIPNFRIRTVPVLGTSPALFGVAAAAWVVCQLAQQPFFPEPHFYVQRPQYEQLLEELQERELRRVGTCDGIMLDIHDVEFLVGSVWGAMSGFAMNSGAKRGRGTHRRTGHLRLVCYDESRLCVPENVVPFTFEEVEEFDQLGLQEWRTQHPAVAEAVEVKLAHVGKVYGSDMKGA